MPALRFLPVSRLALAVAFAAGLAVPAEQVAHAQEVVQPLPPKASEELTNALSRLASNPRNIDALIAAGTASLELDDVEAAVGFFGRAKDLDPNDPRIKAGQAAALVRNRRPIEALKLFEEAEASGVEIVRLAGDYGLAYDLVGNNREAQARYRRALAREESSEVTRRLALSQAIDGDERGFEATLRPLLAQRDFGAYRTRAFGLAILGRADDAVAIAEAVMPRLMASKMEPYLRFMPRLTKAQQAAAANLGVYPTAAQIGRDDPRIAAMGAETSAVRTARTADAGLAPTGTPLGRAPQEPAEKAGAEGVAVASRQEAERTVRVARREAASDPLARTSQRPRIVRRRPDAETSAVTEESVPPAAPTSVVSEPALAKAEPMTGELPPASAEEIPDIEATVRVAGQASADEDEPVVVARLDETTRSPGFDLARVPGTPVAEVELPASSAALGGQPAEISEDAPASVPASVADAFADLAPLPAATSASPSAGAVDITAIEAPREVAAEPEPAKPAHPSRFWVQVATGRDRSALKFDWRRLSRQSGGLLDGKGPYVTAWGQTNRLLAGPYDSRSEARNALNSLTEKDIDAFTFTSPEGQEIETLD